MQLKTLLDLFGKSYVTVYKKDEENNYQEVASGNAKIEENFIGYLRSKVFRIVPCGNRKVWIAIE